MPQFSDVFRPAYRLCLTTACGLITLPAWALDSVTLSTGAVQRYFAENTAPLPAVTETGTMPAVQVQAQGRWAVAGHGTGHLEWQLGLQQTQGQVAYDGFLQKQDGSTAPWQQHNGWRSTHWSGQLGWVWPLTPQWHAMALAGLEQQQQQRDLHQYQENTRHTYALWGAGLRWQANPAWQLELQALQGRTIAARLQAPGLGFDSQLPGSHLTQWAVQAWWQPDNARHRWGLRWQQRREHWGSTALNEHGRWFFPGAEQVQTAVWLHWQHRWGDRSASSRP